MENMYEVTIQHQNSLRLSFSICKLRYLKMRLPNSLNYSHSTVPCKSLLSLTRSIIFSMGSSLLALEGGYR